MKTVLLVRLPPNEQPVPKLARTQMDVALKETSKLLRDCFRDEWDELQKLLRLIKDLEQMNSKDAIPLIDELKPVSKFFLRFTLSVYGLKLGLTESEA